MSTSHVRRWDSRLISCHFFDFQDRSDDAGTPREGQNQMTYGRWILAALIAALVLSSVSVMLHAWLLWATR